MNVLSKIIGPPIPKDVDDSQEALIFYSSNSTENYGNV